MPGHSKVRQYCPARQYSGHDALPVDCKFPWQLIVDNDIRPSLVNGHVPRPQTTTHVQACSMGFA